MAGKKKSKKRKPEEEAYQEPEPEDIEQALTTTAEAEDADEDTDDRELDPVLYLTDDAPTGTPAIVALVPPDMERCQCEWRDQTIETFGPKPIIRCDQEPTVIAFQKRDPDEDGATGAISLCDDHRVMVEHMYPGQCYFRRINQDKKIGDFA